MASFGKNLGYALMGALEGTAEVFEKEDKRRDELTKVTLSTALQRYNELDDERKKKLAEIEAEDAAVKALQGQVITLKDGSKDIISEAQARAAIRRYGAKELNSLLLSESIKFGTEGKIGEAKGTDRQVLNLEAIEGASAKGAGWFAESRYKDVVSNTESTLRAMGIDPNSVVIPGKKEVTGVDIVAGEGTNKVTTDNKYTNIPGLAGGMVTQVSSLSIDGKLTTSYRDLMGNDVTDIVTTALSGSDKKLKIVDNYAALNEDMDWKDKGMAFRFNDDGTFKYQGYDIVFTKDGRVLRRGEESGVYDTPVTDPRIVSLAASKVAEQGGTSAIEDSMDKIGKEGRKAFQEYQTQAEALEYVENIFNRNLELLDEHGNKLVADIGSLANLATYVKTNISAGVEVLKDELGVDYINLADIDIGRAEELRSNLKSQVDAETDPKTKLSLARDLYNANQIVAAYYYAKSTGDTRISNADFDQFFKTISAGTADGQRAVYRDRMRQAAGSVKSKYTTLTSYLGGDNESQLDETDKAMRNRVLGSIPESRLPENIDARITKMFAEDVPTKTTKQVADEITEAEKKAKEYGVQRAYINPKTGELTTNTDPDGIEAFVVMKGDKVARTTLGKPLYDEKSTEKSDVERDLMLMIQNKVLQ